MFVSLPQGPPDSVSEAALSSENASLDLYQNHVVRDGKGFWWNLGAASSFVFNQFPIFKSVVFLNYLFVQDLKLSAGCQSGS